MILIGFALIITMGVLLHFFAPRWKWLVGVLAFLLVWLAPSSLHGFSAHVGDKLVNFGDRPAYALAIASLMALWWIANNFKIYLPALLPFVLYPIFDIFGVGLWGDEWKTITSFCDPLMCVFLGGLVLGKALELSKLHVRFAYWVMSITGTGPYWVLLAVMGTTAFFSMFMSNSATTVMMFYPALTVIKVFEKLAGVPRLPRFGAAMMMGVPWAAGIGGVGTPVGTPPNIIGMNFLETYYHVHITTWQYSKVGILIVAIFLPLVWLWLCAYARKEMATLPDIGRAFIREQWRNLGPMSGHEKRSLLAFSFTVVSWMLESQVLDLLKTSFGYTVGGVAYEATIGMFGAVLALSLGTVPVAKLLQLEYSVLGLIGGSLALAAGITVSGLGYWIKDQLFFVGHWSAFGQVAVASGASVVLTSMVSNSAACGIILSLLKQLPLINPIICIMAATIGSSMVFATPWGTPPCAYVVDNPKKTDTDEGPYVTVGIMVSRGLPVDFFSAVFIALFCYYILPWLW